MADRTAPRRQKAAVVTETKESVDALEEKVLRMRHGYPVADDAPLSRVGQDNPDLAAQLMAIELRALERSGRLAELRREVGLDENGQDTKQKIIDKLGEKNRRR